MSTPEQPATPALTRKQLRDLRNTGATPIVGGDAPATDETATVESDGDHHSEPAPETAPEPVAQPIVAPLPRAAVPVPVHDLPGADSSVDLGVSPLTRRQARQQERIRTASVPVITPEVAAAHVHDEAPAADVHDEAPAAEDAVLVDDASAAESDVAPIEEVPDASSESAEDTPEPADEPAEEEDDAERAIVNPAFGAELLAGQTPAPAVPTSFDQLITRSVTGAVGTGNALILSETPSASALVAPVTATGEVLITGSFNLPEGLGSTGHAPGTADGKEVDAVLVDGELPAHSSPTPIAASAAISTVKNGGDIIKPPAPEKGSRLMLTLAITAGVLALALVGVLILAFVTGVF